MPPTSELSPLDDISTFLCKSSSLVVTLLSSLFVFMFRLAAHRAILRTTTFASTCSRGLHSSPALGQAIQTKFDLPAATRIGNERGIDGETWEPRLTKIVATIGPTSEQLPVLQEVSIRSTRVFKWKESVAHIRLYATQVVKSGMRIMRLNFSHATVEEVELRTKNLRLCEVSLF